MSSISDITKKTLHFVSKLKPYNIQKGLRYLKHFGLKEFLVRLSERLEPEEVPYGPWYDQYKADENSLAAQRAHVFSHKPLFSILVPCYKTPALFLNQMVDSVRAQSYSNWELILANASPEDELLAAELDRLCREEKRIRVVPVPENLGIAQNTNAALEAARGEYISLLDHDDLLAPDALFEAAIRLEADPSIDIFYTDEDKVTEDLSEHLQPHLKPGFNPDLLCSNNYVCHFLTVRTALARRVGGLHPEYNGAQDHDFILRLSEETDRIVRIPRILYHWRLSGGSTADNPSSKLYAYESGVRAITDHLARIGTPARVTMRSDYGFYDVSYPVIGEPMVSILIPNKDHADLLRNCVTSIQEKASYKNYEIVIVENNSEQEETFTYYRELEAQGVRVVTWKGKGFNYSALNNFGARYCKGEYLLLLNNDITVITPDFMEKMLSNVQRPGIGAVGVRLLYPDQTIQHAGIAIGIGGIAGHEFLGLSARKGGYLHKAKLQRNVSAVTAACLMVPKAVFDEVGGLEEALSVAFNDVDFCLRIGEAGYRIVYLPHVEMYHHESKSRGIEDNEEKVRRFQSEIEFMRTRWIKLLKAGDPNYNPNLTLAQWNYTLRGDGKGVKPWKK